MKTPLLYSAFLAAGALSLAGCGSKTTAPSNQADTTGNDTVVAAAPTATAALSPGQAFANAAASSDAFEIAASNIALQSSQSTTIKSFARQMIAAHSQSTGKLKGVAASTSPAIVPDATLTADQQEKLSALQASTGAGFDAAYVATQIAAHQTTLDTLRGYAANADVPALGQFATEMTPIVAAHLNMAQSLKL